MPEAAAPQPVTLADLQAARARIAGLVSMTPLLESPLLNARLGGRVLVKAECLQPIGAFKLRGAMNAIAALTPEERSRGVVAYSSGNHAQAVARAATHFGIPSTIIMPADAPATKIARTKAFGGAVITYDRYTQSREAIGAQVAEETGACLIPPFDHPHVVAGQGTCGLEIADQLEMLGATPDALLVPVSGGGLFAGASLGLCSRYRDLTPIAVEPAGFTDMAATFAAGQIVTQPGEGKSICDALLSPFMGAVPFATIAGLGAQAVSATDEEAKAAMALIFETLRLVTEPGGAIGIAAILNGQVPAEGRTLVVIASGGNVDPALFAEAIAA